MRRRRITPFEWAMVSIALWGLVLGRPLGLQAAGPGASVSGSSPDLSRLARDWNRECQVMSRKLERLPRHEFEVPRLASRLGKEADTLFQWVRDQTVWVPYRGTLRGARGVLMDRRGNSLDRALLLAKLLRLAGHEVRLARGEIADAELETLLARLPLEPRVTTNERSPTRGEDVPHVASQRALEDAIALTRLHEASLSAVVRAAPQEEEARVRAALADHWWVESKREGEWLAFDPLLPDATPGKNVTQATETLGPTELSDELRHRVRLRVVVERMEAGTRSEHVPLEYVFFPDELIGEHAVFFNRPLGGPPQENRSEAEEDADPATLLAEYNKVKEWLPTLMVRGKAITTQSVYTSGKLNPKPNKTALSRGFASAISGLTGGPRGQWTAQWLDFEVLSPGRDVVRVRRQVFDLSGAAARQGGVPDLPEPDILERRGLCASGLVEILFPVCEPNTAFITEKTLAFHVDNREANLALLYALQKDDTALAARWFGRLKRFPAALYAFTALRSHWNPEHALSFYDAPNVFATHVTYELADDAGFELDYAVDIVSNRLGVRRDVLARAAHVRMLQGIVDTHAESAVVPRTGAPRNTSLVLASARAQDIPLIHLRSADDPSIAELELPPDAIARMRAALANGQEVVTPARPVEFSEGERLAWWTVEPSSGETLGIGEHGWGISLAEMKVLWYQAVYMTGPVAVFGWTLACLYVAAFWALWFIGLVQPGVPQLPFTGMQMLLPICAGGRPGAGPRPQLPGGGGRPQLTGPRTTPLPPNYRPPPGVRPRLPGPTTPPRTSPPPPNFQPPPAARPPTPSGPPRTSPPPPDFRPPPGTGPSPPTGPPQTSPPPPNVQPPPAARPSPPTGPPQTSPPPPNVQPPPAARPSPPTGPPQTSPPPPGYKSPPGTDSKPPPPGPYRPPESSKDYEQRVLDWLEKVHGPA